MPRLRINNVHLNVAMEAGPPTAPTLLLLHGFTGSAGSWIDHMRALQDVCSTVAIDALGHGRSDAPSDPCRYAMPHVVRDLVAVLDQIGVAQCAVLGYSMGGRMALHLAAAVPDRISALILESASPGLATAAERAERVAADEQLAARIERDGVAAFVEYWERVPLFSSQHALPTEVRHAQRVQRLQSDPIGLAGSLRGAGTGAQASLWPRLATITVPTLLIAGELDRKFTAINEEMARLLPHAQLAIVPGAGHTIHLEQPQSFDTLVRGFIRSTLWHR